MFPLKGIELGEDIVVAKVNKIKRNLSERILSVEITLEDEENTKITLFTEFGKQQINNKIDNSHDFVPTRFPRKNSLNNSLVKNNVQEAQWQERKFICFETAKGATQDALDKDFICLVYPEEELPGNSLQVKIEKDYYKTFDLLRRMLGIPHNTDKKKARQNNPEIDLIESQFLTFQQEKRELLEKGIREFSQTFGGNYSLIPIEIVEEREEKPINKETNTLKTQQPLN
ncbi:22860_t:CDS:2 [Gigaspora margarita]|uniref:22860_t:CDS:1 n=1 Tax=Gigaspora margarita TaxID=4874 RepID=A0ABM8VWR1_GIGMA|nr:22860_t:CDS:2 [Gigaspora margarita]